jgi:hypothetical protein
VTALRLVLAGALAAAAVLAALLAADVGAWRSALMSGDTVYAATPSRATWRADAKVGGTAKSLLGIDDDLRLRDGLQLYTNAAKLHLRLDNAVDVESARGRAQDVLEPLARDRRKASQVLTLLGILAFQTSAAGGTQSQVDAALSDFADAVRADPGNEDAAFDLELLIRMLAAHGSRVEPGQGGGFGRTGHRSAGGGQAGAGY